MEFTPTCYGQSLAFHGSPMHQVLCSSVVSLKKVRSSKPEDSVWQDKLTVWKMNWPNNKYSGSHHMDSVTMLSVDLVMYHV